MGILLELPKGLRRYSQERDFLELEGDCIGEVLEDLARRYSELGLRVLDDDGQLFSHLVVIRGDEVLGREGLLAVRVRDGERLRLFAAAAGG